MPSHRWMTTLALTVVLVAACAGDDGRAAGPDGDPAGSNDDPAAVDGDDGTDDDEGDADDDTNDVDDEVGGHTDVADPGDDDGDVDDGDADDGPDDELLYDCQGVSTTAAELTQAPAVEDLDDHPGAASFAGFVDEVSEWRALIVEDDRLGAIRPLEPPEVLDGEVRDHERLVIERRGEPGDGEADEHGWMMWSSGPCSLRAVLDDLGPATVLLDPDVELSSDDTTLSLWVVEQACASGQPAEDRVRIHLEETDEQVRLVVGVEPVEGAATCPSNPPTPVTVDLDEPLDGRDLVDAGRLPVLPLEPAPDDLPPPS